MTKMCVRCGSRPREEDLFVCSVCVCDPVKADEVRQANVAVAEVKDPKERSAAARKYLVFAFHWSGGWGRNG